MDFENMMHLIKVKRQVIRKLNEQIKEMEQKMNIKNI